MDVCPVMEATSALRKGTFFLIYTELPGRLAATLTALNQPAGEPDCFLGPDCDHRGRGAVCLRCPKTGLGLRKNFLT